MSISIGKTPRYEVSDIALTIYTNASNLLKLNTNQTRNDIQFRNFKLGQHITDPTALQLYQSNILLTQTTSNQQIFFKNAAFQSNITISKNLTIQSNLTALNFDSSNLQIQYLSGSPLRIYDSMQNIFLDLNSGGDLRYMGNIGIGKTQPMYALDVNNSAYIRSNVYDGTTNLYAFASITNASNIYVNDVRSINLQNSLIFETDSLKWTAPNIIINNPTLLGTVSYDGTISLQQSIINTLESCNIRVINKSLNNYGLYIKQLNTTFGLTSNHNALHIDSYFSSIDQTLPIFVIDTFGRISSGRYSSNLPSQDALFSYNIDDSRDVYLSGFMNLYTCNAYEQTIIDKRGHIGIGTNDTQHFLQITNPYTSFESYYQRQPSLIGLYQLTSNAKPYMMLYNCNEAICFNITSNGDILFQSEKLYDQRYRLEVTSNAYIKYLHIDQFESSTGIVNFTQSYLSNINQIITNRIDVNALGLLSNITITGLKVEDMNIGAFDYINNPSTEYEEFRISTTRLLYTGSNFVMNRNRLFFDFEQSNLTNDKMRIYANGTATEEVNVIHTIANNRTSTFNITNCNTALNSIAQIQFDANNNMYQFGVINTTDFYGEGYITCNADITDPNRELNFTNDGTRIGTKIHLSKIGRVTLNDTAAGVHNLGMNGPMEIISETTGASNFIITSQGNIGFGTNQPRTSVHIDSSNILLIGNVGIGVLTPTDRLHISGTLNAKRVLGVKYTDLRGGAFNQWRLVDGGVYFRELASNVGIGTINPTASLHIYTSNYRTPSFASYMTNIPLPTMQYNPLCNQLKISGGMVSGYDSTSNQYRAPKDSLIVDGSIGIGTTYPIKKLHVHQNVKFAENTSNDTNVYVGTNYDVYISTKLTDGNVTVRSGSYETIQTSLTEGFSNIAYYPPTGMVRNSAITADGSVIEWDDMSVDGQGLLAGLSNIVLAPIGYYHGVVINTNGTNYDNVTPYYTQITVPVSLSNIIATAQQVHKFEFTSDGRYGGGSLYLSGFYNDFTSRQSIIENRIYSRGTQKSELLIFKGNVSSTFDAYVWTSVCWSPELSIYVAVGWNGIIGTSVNGLYWVTNQISGYENEYWSSIIWSPERSLFVVVGWSSYVLTSPNGTTWTASSVPYNIWNSVCWSGTLFVAVGWGRILTSSNGTTWAQITAPADNIWQSICWAPQLSLFVAVAYAGANNRVMTSSNGSTWTTQTTPINSWQSVCWSGSLFVAVASSGTNDRVMTSANGTSWTTRTSAIDNDWFSVVWSPQLSLFVAVAYSYTGNANKVMTSSTGTGTWTASSDINTSKWRSVCWSPQQLTFVAVGGEGSSRAMKSTTGTQWDTIPSNLKQTIRMRAGSIAADVYSTATTDRNAENIRGYVTNTSISGFSNITANTLKVNTITDTSGIPILQRNIYSIPGPFTIPKPTILKYSYARIQVWGAGGGGGGADFQATAADGIGSIVPGGGGGGGGAYGEVIIPWHIVANSTLTANIGYGGTGGLGGYIATSTKIDQDRISYTGGVGQAGTNGANGTATVLSLSMVSGNSTLTANWYANGGTGGRVGVGTNAGLSGSGGLLLGTFDLSYSGASGGTGGSTAAGANGPAFIAYGSASSGGGGGGGLPNTLPAPKLNYSGGNSGIGCRPAAYLSGTPAKALGEFTNNLGTIHTASQAGYSIYDTYAGGTGGGGSASLASTIAGGLAIVNSGKVGGWPGGGGGGGGSAKQVFPNVGYSGYGASVTAGYGGNGGNGAIIITYY